MKVHSTKTVPLQTIACLLHNSVINCLEIELSSIVILTYYVVKVAIKALLSERRLKDNCLLASCDMAWWPRAFLRMHDIAISLRST